MKRNFLLMIFVSFMFVQCTTDNSKDKIEEYKKEILQVEADFVKMAVDSGIRIAFMNFAADSAVLNRNNTLFIGKESIGLLYDNDAYLEIKLDWKPDYVDVSTSGDLAYTYGRFTLTSKDTTGNPVENKGVFHTVWKRQENGNWKYVWD